MPPMLFGAFIGSFISELAPNIFQLTLLSIVLVFLVVNTFFKGIKRWEKETKQLEAEKHNSNANNGVIHL